MTGVFIVPEQRKVTCSVLFYFRLVPEAFKCEPMHRKGKPYHLFSHIFRPEFVKYNQLRRQLFEVYTARVLNNHITHRITAVFVMKTTREVFIIMRAGKIDKRDHEIDKKIKFCQFVNNTSYGLQPCNFILGWKYTGNGFKMNKKQL